MLLPRHELELRLERFAPTYDHHYRRLMLRRLGFDAARGAANDADREAIRNQPGRMEPDEQADLVPLTLQLLASWPVGYGAFFTGLTQRIKQGGIPRHPGIWSRFWAAPSIAHCLGRWYLPQTPIRPVIEGLWEAMDQRDDWEPFQQWVRATMTTSGATI